jgi:hypothetical protein
MNGLRVEGRRHCQLGINQEKRCRMKERPGSSWIHNYWWIVMLSMSTHGTQQWLGAWYSLLLLCRWPECRNSLHFFSWQAGLVGLPSLDAVLPCALGRIARLYDPTPDYDYISASLVYDLMKLRSRSCRWDSMSVLGKSEIATEKRRVQGFCKWFS